MYAFVIGFIFVLWVCYEVDRGRKRNGQPGIPVLGYIFDSISVHVHEDIEKSSRSKSPAKKKKRSSRHHHKKDSKSDKKSSKHDKKHHKHHKKSSSMESKDEKPVEGDKNAKQPPSGNRPGTASVITEIL